MATVTTRAAVAPPPDDTLRGLSRDQFFQDYLAIEKIDGSNEDRLSFLDKGIKGSPFQKDVESGAYTERLRIRPDDAQVAASAEFHQFPKRSEMPTIHSDGLQFLHPDVTEACVCQADFLPGSRDIRVRWLGRHATRETEYLSSTKMVGALFLVDKANAASPEVDLDDCSIGSAANGGATPAFSLLRDMVRYGEDGHQTRLSNQIGKMLKEFGTPKQVEDWVASCTGNTEVFFRGGYGEPPLIADPALFVTASGTRVLGPAPGDHPTGKVPENKNRVSAYDLTRLMAMCAFHHHLPGKDERFASAQWHSLETAVRALGYDTARFVDVGLKKLRMLPHLRDVVILSKLGFGQSAMTQCAAIQFVDRRNPLRPRYRALTMTLRIARGAGPTSDAAIEVDARMAAEVTEILRRLILGEL